MDLATRDRILDEAICILLGTNILEKVMNPTISLPHLWVIRRANRSLNLSIKIGLGEGKLLI